MQNPNALEGWLSGVEQSTTSVKLSYYTLAETHINLAHPTTMTIRIAQMK